MSGLGLIQVELARAVATVAHHGQVDKAGLPYVGHPGRVAEIVEARHAAGLISAGQPSWVALPAAWLHDVLEDTELTGEDLMAAGISGRVVSCVTLLTRTRGQSSEDYYAAIAADSMARAVKLADIEDNMDPKRLALLPDETIVRLVRKYANALELVTA